MDETTTAAPQFDLSKYELADTGILTVKNKGGNDDLIGADGKNPVTIELYSPGSEPGVKAKRKHAYAAQMRLTRTLRGEIDKSDAAQAEREQAERLSAFTLTVNNFPVPALDLYSNPKLLYITAQAEAFIGKFENF